MKNKRLKIFLALLLAAVAGWIVWDSRRTGEAKIILGGQEFYVELADDASEQERGLGERDTLCRECAMLFVFSEKKKYSFWMKGMRFPLDILWFDSADGRIVHLEKNVPADSKQVFAPDVPADRVLEVNGGLADEYGIQEGDQIYWIK